MALQRVDFQLSKTLHLNAEDIDATDPPAIPDIMPNPPLQPTFTTYSNGYRAGIQVFKQRIPARPADGRGTAHPYEVATHKSLHPILFQMEPVPNQLAGGPVPKLLDEATDQPVLGNDGTELRYFSHLPRWVDHDVSGMLMELWLRLDPRLEMRDIMNRINLHPMKRARSSGSFSMRRNRFREAIEVPPYNSGRQHPEAFEVDVISNRSREQMLLNTCMIVDWPNKRMLKPVMSDDRTIIGYIDSRLPLDYFLRGFPNLPDPIPIPSDRQQIVLALRHRLQTLAMTQNLGTHSDNYKRLPANLTPSWWHKNADPATATPMLLIDGPPGKTHNEWIAELFLQYPGITRTGVQRTTPSRPAPAAAPVAPPAPALLQPPPPMEVAPLPPAALPAQQAPVAQPGQAIFDPSAGDGAPVGPWGCEDGMGGFHHYVEPAHRQWVMEEAARRAQEQTALDEERREVEDAVRFAMRNCVRHSLYDN
ncbi:hypothetical protein H2200_004009 [Cladophialophora chaetospira]|uniref:Uncharacterized protein n=1 Tax=Cladophialophora chaetospira TaxID=386627 RepID=A0AA39CLA2_9EURO|nr:hypothetical protein H2200_004009 [Cladophialophora chaetospira]